MSRLHLVLLALPFATACGDPADLVKVSFTRIECTSKTSCEAGLRRFVLTHANEYALALDYRSKPEPGLIITHGNFGDVPVRALRVDLPDEIVGDQPLALR